MQLQQRARPGRLEGVDVARALAVLGMITIHVGSFTADDALSEAYYLPYGRAFVTFVFLAGVGVSLLAGNRSPQRVKRTWVTILVRFVILLPLGLLLQSLDTPIIVILHYYAVFFVFTAFLVPLSDRALLAVALALAVLAPLAYYGLSEAFREPFQIGRQVRLDNPGQIVRDLFVTGWYPLLTSSVPLTAGMWIGRQDLRKDAVRLRIAVGGFAVAAIAFTIGYVAREVIGIPTIAGWGRLFVTEGHSEMPLSVIGSTAIGTTVLGLGLLVADRLPRTLWPLAAMGRMTLSVYVGHILVFLWAPTWLEGTTATDAVLTVLTFLLFAAAASVTWLAFFPRGPLETVMYWPIKALTARLALDPPPVGDRRVVPMSEHTQWYQASEDPELVTFGPVAGLGASGVGAPGGPEHSGAIAALYAVAGQIAGQAARIGKPFPMPPLEGRWWVESGDPPLETPRDQWRWHLFLRLPDWLPADWADRGRDAARAAGAGPEVARVQHVAFTLGRCVQALHRGPYTDEPRTLARMDALLAGNGMQPEGLHHEIYLTDFNGPAEQARTILRQPVRPAGVPAAAQWSPPPEQADVDAAPPDPPAQTPPVEVPTVPRGLTPPAPQPVPPS